MKILFVAPYITTKVHKAYMRNQTGFGYMVYDIAKHVGATENVDLFAVNVFAPGLRLENFNTVSRTPLKFLSGLKLKGLADGMKFLSKYRLPLRERIRTLYQYAAVGQMERKIGNYDLVHIHGCTPITDAAIRACRRHGIPFVVTLHGLVSFEDIVRLHPSLKQYERDFLVESFLNDYEVTFISSGNREAALEYVKSMTQPCR